LRSQILQQNTILRMKLTQDTTQFVTNEHIWQGISVVSVMQSFSANFQRGPLEAAKGMRCAIVDRLLPNFAAAWFVKVRPGMVWQIFSERSRKFCGDWKFFYSAECMLWLKLRYLNIISRKCVFFFWRCRCVVRKRRLVGESMYFAGRSCAIFAVRCLLEQMIVRQRISERRRCAG
jgi:hypothetical protein